MCLQKEPPEKVAWSLRQLAPLLCPHDEGARADGVSAALDGVLTGLAMTPQAKGGDKRGNGLEPHGLQAVGSKLR